MLAPTVIALMIANVTAATGAYFAAWQISALENPRRRHSARTQTRDAAGSASFAGPSATDSAPRAAPDRAGNLLPLPPGEVEPNLQRLAA
jgi:hypothetical protein